ncbi:UNVERIFIED_CONTAM: hypothetical protein FKN15_012855 [Acipenser sinensis]
MWRACRITAHPASLRIALQSPQTSVHTERGAHDASLRIPPPCASLCSRRRPLFTLNVARMTHHCASRLLAHRSAVAADLCSHRTWRACRIIAHSAFLSIVLQSPQTSVHTERGAHDASLRIPPPCASLCSRRRPLFIPNVACMPHHCASRLLAHCSAVAADLCSHRTWRACRIIAHRSAVAADLCSLQTWHACRIIAHPTCLRIALQSPQTSVHTERGRENQWVVCCYITAATNSKYQREGKTLFILKTQSMVKKYIYISSNEQPPPPERETPQPQRLTESPQSPPEPPRETATSPEPPREHRVARAPKRDRHVTRAPEREHRVARAPKRDRHVTRAPEREHRVARAPERDRHVARAPEREHRLATRTRRTVAW